MKWLQKFKKGHLIEPFIYVDFDDRIVRAHRGNRIKWLEKHYIYSFTFQGAVHATKKLTEKKYPQYAGSIYYF
jgi:hypothetical protein